MLLVFALWGKDNVLSLFQIYTIIFLLSALNPFYAIALESSIPNICYESNLKTVNSRNRSIVPLSRIIAPLIGGLIINYIPFLLFFVINGISFVLSTLIELAIDFNINGSVNLSDKKFKAKDVILDLKDGVCFSMTSPVIKGVIIFSVVMNFAFHLGFSTPMPVIALNVLKLTSNQYAMIQSSMSIGAFLAAYLFSLIANKVKIEQTLYLSIFLLGSFIVVLGSVSLGFVKNNLVSTIIMILIGVVLGSSIVIASISLSIVTQMKVPDDYRGRIFGLMGAVANLAIPAGVALSGFLIEKFDVFFVSLTGGVLILITVLNLRTKMSRN